MTEPTPSTTMHHDVVSSNSEAPIEHVMTVNNPGTYVSNSIEVNNNLAMAPESNSKFLEDKEKLDVIAAPNFMEQVSPLCRICKEGKTGDDDPLICLGCSCPSDLRQAHRSCIKVYFGKRVNRGEHFCRLCRDVLKYRIYKLALGCSSDDTDVDDKSGSVKIQPKQAGFKGIRICPTPPLPSDHQVGTHPTLDAVNARRAEAALRKRAMLVRFEKLLLLVLMVLVVLILVLVIVRVSLWNVE